MRTLKPTPIDTTLNINHSTRTVQPNSSEADDYYGLALGSNGTAAQGRRASAPEGYTWLRADGAPAYGITLTPSANSDTEFVNPWTGDHQ